jgi:hypothetical protein
MSCIRSISRGSSCFDSPCATCVSPSKPCAITVFVIGILIIGTCVGLGQSNLFNYQISVILTIAGSIVGALPTVYGLFHLILGCWRQRRVATHNEEIKKELTNLENTIQNCSRAQDIKKNLPVLPNMANLTEDGKEGITEFSGTISNNHGNYFNLLRADLDRATRDGRMATFGYEGHISPTQINIRYKLRAQVPKS